MTKVRIVGRKVLVSILILILLFSTLLVFPVSAASSWSKPRPSSYTVYDETIGNANTDGRASIGLGVQISDYIENTATIPYDVLRFRISVSANTREGIQYDVQWPWDYDWYDVSNPIGIIVDGIGVNLTFLLLFFTMELNITKFGCTMMDL